MQIKNPFRGLALKTLIAKPVKLTDGSDAFFTMFPNWTNVKNTTTMAGQAWAYNQCPPVNSIINKKVRSFTNGIWRIVNENGDEVKGPQVEGIRSLLKRPNPMQTWNEFIAQAKVYEQTFGECYILPVTPVGFNHSDAGALWVVPNWLITEKITGKIFAQTEASGLIEEYQLEFNGYKTSIKADEILRIRDVSVYVTQQPELILHGMSRLYPLSDPVSNIVAAYQARNVLITRKGALGILSNDGKDVGGTIPLKPKEKEDLQKDFQKYGLSAEQYQVIITNASLKWQTMTFPTRSLMLFEEIADDTRQIADCYDYPMYLLGFKEGSTFSNVGEAKKSLYQDAIIPESEAWSQALSTFFQLPDGVRLQITYDHLEIFQRSRKDVADALRLMNQGMVIAFQNQIISREEWRSAIELDPENIMGSTFYEGPTPEVKPGDVAHAEQPKPRT